MTFAVTRLIRVRRRPCFEPLSHLLRGQQPEQPQQVGDALDAPDAAVGREPLNFEFVPHDDVGVEQLAHLDAAE